MRVMLAAGALLSLAGGAVRAIHGDWTWAAICACAFWACSGLFIAYVSGNRQVDNAIREDEDNAS